MRPPAKIIQAHDREQDDKHTNEPRQQDYGLWTSDDHQNDLKEGDVGSSQ